MKYTIQRTAMADGSVVTDSYSSENELLDYALHDNGALTIEVDNIPVAVYARGAWDRLTTDAAEKMAPTLPPEECYENLLP